MTVYVRCPKCKSLSGDDWKQCAGKCPLIVSPHHDFETAEKYGDFEIVKEDEVKHD